MHDDAVFTRDGERFLPGRHAIGPWAPDKLHGGPVLGLMVRAALAAQPDPALVLARLSVDMFRPVPAAPLTVAVESLRRGARLALLRVTLSGEAGALAQGTALLLRADDDAPDDAPARTTSTLAPPDDLPSESLMRSMPPSSNRPKGFHTRVETRWPQRAAGEPLAIWFRLPLPLVAGEDTGATIAAVALSDFANAVASIAQAGRGRGAPYINADTTLYLTRRPQGEWFALQDQGQEAHRGISTAQCLLWDRHGPLGRALQARLIAR